MQFKVMVYGYFDEPYGVQQIMYTVSYTKEKWCICMYIEVGKQLDYDFYINTYIDMVFIKGRKYLKRTLKQEIIRDKDKRDSNRTNIIIEPEFYQYTVMHLCT